MISEDRLTERVDNRAGLLYAKFGRLDLNFNFRHDNIFVLDTVILNKSAINTAHYACLLPLFKFDKVSLKQTFDKQELGKYSANTSTEYVVL